MEIALGDELLVELTDQAFEFAVRGRGFKILGGRLRQFGAGHVPAEVDALPQPDQPDLLESTRT